MHHALLLFIIIKYFSNIVILHIHCCGSRLYYTYEDYIKSGMQNFPDSETIDSLTQK